ncbi:ABC transporter ATP-binding protein [Mesorhizobium sp.]|uniref:ABC transporter ATP-binding protein n=1 Tax=Mesorhizobium sp. TaxID=1871066 RepID=UPI000FE6FE03|nr:ABC transporter ATP-binding protein [Mesorhizobium sp.]RWJ32011.1 MAG: ABC transporter ATP-binding protein [Mesorhizobium sp.]TIQ73783.1 MAG: ABC transporter ATP-binding protein [Mesorhizobium sp.]
MSEPQVELKNVSFKYEASVRGGIDSLSLQIAKGEFVSLLGRSGCGKTTTLKIVAGLLDPFKGEVRIRGTNVTQLGPEKRNISMVFQNYALFPHMDVFDNVSFGLKMKRELPATERVAKVEAVLDLIGLQDFRHKHPKELSGGQQQRVGLARAIVTEPDVMLLDEPLSNLDAQLRESMCVELMNLQRRLKLSVLYVTHDRAEALSMSDRIAVMDGGCIVQIDTPTRLYRAPEYAITAKTLGEANIWPLAALPEAFIAEVRAHQSGSVSDTDASIMIRPEDISICETSALDRKGLRLKAKIAAVVYRGDQYRLLLSIPELNQQALCAVRASGDEAPVIGSSTPIFIDHGKIRVVRSAASGAGPT